MNKNTFDRIDGLVNQTKLRELHNISFDLIQDVLKEEPFEIEDVLEYIMTIIKDDAKKYFKQEVDYDTSYTSHYVID
jgi:hypothetical protein